jgi:hypothetical protein
MMPLVSARADKSVEEWRAEDYASGNQGIARREPQLAMGGLCAGGAAAGSRAIPTSTGARTGAGTGDPPFEITSPPAFGHIRNAGSRFHSICVMPAYAHKSFEELRAEDYSIGNRAIAPRAPGPGAGGGCSSTEAGAGDAGTDAGTVNSRAPSGVAHASTQAPSPIVVRAQPTAAAFDRQRALAQGVDVRPSQVPGAGDGLWAVRPFHRYEVICEYTGRVLTLAKVLKMSTAERDYVMGGFGLNVHIDGRHDLNMLARYINDNGCPSRINADFVKLRTDRKALVRALRPIEAGEEIFAHYGEGYWRARSTAPALSAADIPGRRARIAMRAVMLAIPVAGGVVLAMLRAGKRS